MWCGFIVVVFWLCFFDCFVVVFSYNFSVCGVVVFVFVAAFIWALQA